MHTGRVTLSKDIPPTIQFDTTDAVQDLVKQVHELDRISRRASAIINARHVGHMAVVRLVQIFAVPARLELNLSTKTVVAHRHVHFGGFGIRRVGQAIEADAVTIRFST